MQNRKAALERLTRSAPFRKFLYHKVHQLAMGKTVEEIVEAQLTPDRLKVEVRDEEGQWVEEDVS